jgi:GTPase
MVSNVTGKNLPMLRTFLNVLPSSQMDDKYVVDAPFEFQISDVFSVPFVGTVVVSPIHLSFGQCLHRRAASLRLVESSVS